MEILIILVLTLVNGFFALSEIALVSVKKSSMEHLAAQGKSRAKMVLQLLENPENFLSSVQVGITLIGIVSGAYGGAALTDDLDQLLHDALLVNIVTACRHAITQHLLQPAPLILQLQLAHTVRRNVIHRLII